MAVLVIAAIYGLSANKGVSTDTTPGGTTDTATEVTTHVLAAAAPLGPVSDSVVVKRIAPENASNALLSGEIDYYLSSLTPEQAVSLKENPDVKLYYAASQVNGIILNPAPAPAGELNPFSLQGVRFAMQYLIDREGIVRDVNKGFGIPIMINLVPAHPSYAMVEDAVKSFGISYDKTRAEGMITAAMESAGAEKSNGVWTYNDKAITLKVIVSENPDMAGIANTVSSELESAGFKIEKIPVKRGEDSPSDISDPSELKWNLEATAWIYYGFSKYNEVAFPELYSKEGWWEYNNTQMTAAGDRVANISSEAEWVQINQEMAELGINDSVGIWLTAKNNVFAAGSDVQGLTDDRFVGLRSYGNIREAFVPGKNLSVGNAYTYESGSSWNPLVIEGIEMMDIVNTIQDPATWSNPVTLETQPFRMGYSIETNGPDSQMSVPQDAFTWNYTSNVWQAVGEGVMAKTKVTFDLSKYLGAKWHHGVSITWADVLYNLAGEWDISLDSEKREALDGFMEDTFKLVKGMRIDGDKLEVYLSIWSFDDDDLQVLDTTFQRLAPWELFASMDELVFKEKSFVYYEYYRPEGNASAICLVNDSHVQAVLSALDSLDFSKVAPFMTAGGTVYATEAGLAERTSALKAWAGRYEHLVIGDGPFYMASYEPNDGSVELKAFRDPTYPFKKGDWQLS